jgi:uncharacterized cupredoxin-like copper-binding protein
MSALLTPETINEEADAPTAGDPLVREVAALRAEMRAQGTRMVSAQRAFSIFAVFAFLLAGATFLAVAFKLDRSPRTITKVASVAPVAANRSTPVGPAALPHSVSVGLGEFFVRPSAATAAAGKVTFRVHNAGTATHEFVVIRTPKPAGSLLKGARADESGNVGETGDLPVGKSKAITLALKPGHYALICNLPGHYSAGQHTDFTVR